MNPSCTSGLRTATICRSLHSSPALILAASIAVLGCTKNEPPTNGAPSPGGGEPFPSCEDPTAAPGAFEDGLSGSGVDFVHGVDISFLLDPEDFTLPMAFTVGAGLVAADLDRDGSVDLVFAQTVGPNEIWWGRGDGSFEAGDPGDLALPDELSSAVSAADFDGDGDLDLAVVFLDGMTLLRLDEDRQFVDVTSETGVGGGLGWAGTPSWGDYDGDGDLDLYEGRHATAVYEDETIDAATDRLWRNENGTFTDRSGDLPFPDGLDGAWLHGVWEDLDLDGDLDLVQVNDFGDTSANSSLWANEGPGQEENWQWTDRIQESGLGLLVAPMGAAVRDFDGDEWPDLWFSDIGGMSLFRSTGPWSWVEAGAAWASTTSHVISDISWSVVDIDLAGDGLPAVLVTYGPLPAEPNDPGYDPDQPDRFFVQEQAPGEEPRFVDRGDQVFPSVQDGNSRGVGLADLNADGVPDLVIGHIGGPPSILLGRCTTANRLVLELQDLGTANRFGIGARVTVEAGGRVQTQTLRAGGRGTYSGSDPVLFFGLGDAEQVDRITVTWPDDGELQVLEQLCAHCKIVVERDAR
ncbi:MAG: CRTAC1 family protein [Myxococcota bacterium]|nr:CRTAC1 family protein [Myxococcota bacterium]